MEENKFFKLIWRIVAIGLLLMIVAGLYSFIRNELKRLNRANLHRVEPIATLDKDPHKVEKWVLGQGMKMYGSSYILLPLISKNKTLNDKYRVYYEGIGAGLAKNILFVNHKDNSSSWLFKTNHQLIDTYNVFPTPYMEKDGLIIQFIYYKMSDTDTNGDKKVTLADAQNLAISNTSGQKYKVLVKGIERIVFVDGSDNNSVLFIYEKDDTEHSLKFNLDTFEIVSDVVLPKAGV